MSINASLNSGISALRTFGTTISTIGDNIANSNTTGFKASRARNEDGFSQTLMAADGQRSSMQVGSGVSLSSVRQNFTQGSLTTTGVPTDLGLAGNGFFKVTNALTNKDSYTRDGSFRVDTNSYLVTPQGLQLQGVLTTEAAVDPIVAVSTGIKLGATLPAATDPLAKLQSYAIGNDGKITEFYSDGTSNDGDAGQKSVILFNFKDPSALVRASGNLYEPPVDSLFVSVTGAQPGAGGVGQIKQGTLELSNVDLAQEFSELIIAQRSFQAGSRIISVTDSLMEEVVNLKR